MDGSRDDCNVKADETSAPCIDSGIETTPAKSQVNLLRVCIIIIIIYKPLQLIEIEKEESAQAMKERRKRCKSRRALKDICDKKDNADDRILTVDCVQSDFLDNSQNDFPDSSRNEYCFTYRFNKDSMPITHYNLCELWKKRRLAYEIAMEEETSLMNEARDFEEQELKIQDKAKCAKETFKKNLNALYKAEEIGSLSAASSLY